MGRRDIDGRHEAILARFDHFCGIYGALSASRLASWSPAFRLKQTARKYNSPKGLFTRREGYPSKRVNPSWRAKDSLGLQATDFTGRVTLQPGTT